MLVRIFALLYYYLLLLFYLMFLYLLEYNFHLYTNYNNLLLMIHLLHLLLYKLVIYTTLHFLCFHGISNLRVYGTLKNVLTLTKYTGVDPTTVTTTGLWPGIGGLEVYPTARNLTFGVQISY